jgi:hypothetical protein
MTTLETMSLKLAAWLRTEGIPLVRVDRVNGSSLFVFDNSQGQASRAMDVYYSSPRGEWASDILSAYHALRSLALSSRREEARDGKAA